MDQPLLFYNSSVHRIQTPGVITHPGVLSVNSVDLSSVSRDHRMKHQW